MNIDDQRPTSGRPTLYFWKILNGHNS